MKITVSYNVDFEIDIPKSEILAAMEDSEDELDLGGRLNELAQKYQPKIEEALSKCYNAEISGVYQTWEQGSNPWEFILPEDDVDEVLWEG